MADRRERHFISLGAGVQSSVMLLLAEHGTFTPKPEGAIFADTQWEPPEVYETLDWLESQVSIPIYRVTAGNIREDSIAGTTRAGQPVNLEDNKATFISMPLFTRDGGIGSRVCTDKYKIRPIHRKVRELCGVGKGERFPPGMIVVTWMGITLDEATRMKTAPEIWRENFYPFIEGPDVWRRIDCLQWFAKHYPGRTLAKSACLGCPYHDREAWLRIKGDPQLWNDVVEFDQQVRHIGNQGDSSKDHFLHRQCVPLDQADLKEDQGDLWDNECEGMCGL